MTFVLLVVLAPARAPAQQQSHDFDLQTFHTISTTGGLFTVEGTEIGAHLKPRAALQLLYQRDPLVYDDLGQGSSTAVSDRINAEISFCMGFFNRVELGLTLPVVLYQGGEESRFASQPDQSGIGDMRLLPKVRLLGNGLEGLSLSLAVGVRLPTASGALMAGGNWSVDPQSLLSYRKGSLSLHLMAGYRFQQERQLFDLVVDDQLLAGLGARYHLGRLGVLAEVTAATAAASPFSEQSTTPVLAMAGLSYTRAGFTVTAGAGPGLVPGFGSPAAQAMLSVGYAPWGTDADGDGIQDRDDACPLQPEDRDGYMDADGCPDPDNDGDGIADARDRCPLQPEDKDGYEDADGCPDPDNDGDGIADAKDRCPDVPETFNRLEDEDGCPEADKDGDGILDSDDRCPLVREDTNGIQDDDGCPDDPDGDGILGDKDRCPDEPETFNKYHDEDGCPDEIKQRVVIRDDSIWTSEAIYFESDSWIIKPRFRQLLRKMAQAIRENRRIKVVYVEGHADPRGSERYNQWLSFYRAEEVMLYLRRQGVGRTRLRAMGYGEQRPTTDDLSAKGAARNRRVMFHLVHWQQREQDAGGEEP